ncbi:MBL fold metallo-hydrolase [Peribacillus frigoritolerans]|uniref:MBL fold metallo-hydrolase n=1 Tax=Peribacillus frigoritolerans TaxID=450367 RepID=UPI0035D4F151
MPLYRLKRGFSVYPIIVPTKYSVKSFNFYIVEDGDYLSLIDAGIDSDECWDQFINTLSEIGYTLKDLSQIILTHTHEDHIGLVNRILSLREIPIYAHSKSIPRLKLDKGFQALRIKFYKQLYDEMGCGESGTRQIERLLKGIQDREKYTVHADIIPLSKTDRISGLQVIETPGHAPDHLAFYQAEKKWLFGGDHLIGHISSNAIIEPDLEGKRLLTLKEYIHSLETCQKLDVETVFAGHGRQIFNPKDLITMRINKIHQKSDQIMGLIKRGVSTADQLARTFYKDKYQSQFDLVMSEIIGHVDYLEVLNKINKELKDGVWHYTQA